MSNDNDLELARERLVGEIKKQALGEPFGLSANFTIMDVRAPNGQVLPNMLCLVAVITMRNPMLDQPKLCFPVTIPMQPGFYLPDGIFPDIAKMALEGIRGLHAQMLSTLNEMDANATVK